MICDLRTYADDRMTPPYVRVHPPQTRTQVRRSCEQSLLPGKPTSPQNLITMLKHLKNQTIPGVNIQLPPLLPPGHGRVKVLALGEVSGKGSGQVRSGQVRSGQVRLCPVTSIRGIFERVWKSALRPTDTLKFACIVLGHLSLVRGETISH